MPRQAARHVATDSHAQGFGCENRSQPVAGASEECAPFPTHACTVIASAWSDTQIDTQTRGHGCTPHDTTDNTLRWNQQHRTSAYAVDMRLSNSGSGSWGSNPCTPANEIGHYKAVKRPSWRVRLTIFFHACAAKVSSSAAATTPASAMSRS